MNCHNCGTPLERKPGESPCNYRTRRYCNNACRQTAAMRQRHTNSREALIEDTEFLLDARERGEHIARRLGYANVESLERVLQRHNRHDLARRLLAAAL